VASLGQGSGETQVNGIWNWLKGVKNRAEEKLVTEEKVRTLIDDLFAVLNAGVAFTPSPLDNLALLALESRIDKGVLAAVLAARLRDVL
jgi:hypothetical protein